MLCWSENGPKSSKVSLYIGEEWRDTSREWRERVQVEQWVGYVYDKEEGYCESGVGSRLNGPVRKDYELHRRLYSKLGP